MDVYAIIAIVFALVSMFFMLLGVFGLFRFPDVYTRLHAATKCTTFGSIFVMLIVVLVGIRGLVEGGNDGSYITMIVHTLLVLVALLITNPTGSHAIARAARRTGLKPDPAVVDEFEEVD